jgi:pimeloyl-ACP methyl ester carboxylesterase
MQTETETQTVRSRDGTAIAFDKAGQGPPLIIVDGALCYRAAGPSGPLAAQLAQRFTVYTYDRRGRGDSGDTPPYEVQREIEDLEALIEHAGGSAYVCGASSGAVLALEAAKQGLPIDKLALYEPPFIVDDSRTPMPDDYVAQLDECLAAGRRGDAVKLFMRNVGVPAVFVAIMPLMPAWAKLKAVAHTLPYDAAVMGESQRGRPFHADRWRSVAPPTLVIVGGKSPAWMQTAAQVLTIALPDAERRTLDGQTHMVKAKVVAPVLSEYFGS